MCVGIFSQTGAQYSAAEKTRPKAEECRVEADAPQVVSHIFWTILFLFLSSLDVLVRCTLKDKVLLRVSPRYYVVLLWVSGVCQIVC